MGIIMADRLSSDVMNLEERGGVHEFMYQDGRSVPPSPGPTPSQTIGPFFAYGLTPGSYGYPLKEVHTADLAGPEVPGERITIEGQVFDGDGMPVDDALVEIMQADSLGAYITAPRRDGFTGYGRAGTGANGPAHKGGDTRFVFRTVKPGPTAPGAAPFIAVVVTMRGLLNHCITRIYFPEDQIDQDPIMVSVPAERRDTLVAKYIEPMRYRFDVRMRGNAETVFFDI